MVLTNFMRPCFTTLIPSDLRVRQPKLTIRGGHTAHRHQRLTGHNACGAAVVHRPPLNIVIGQLFMGDIRGRARGHVAEGTIRLLRMMLCRGETARASGPACTP